MTTLLQDLRYAARWLVKNPGFTAVAVLTLAFGIGTVTTILSIVDAAVLRPLPYRDPDTLTTVAITHREGNAAPETFSWSSPKFDSLRRHAPPSTPSPRTRASTSTGPAALVACYLPARRAAHVDPMTALRSE